MEKSFDVSARCCSGCGIVLTKDVQSEALARNRRKLCTRCASARTASYSPRYRDAKNLAKRRWRAAQEKTVVKPSDRERLEEKMKFLADDECWPWLGAIQKQTGYGAFRLHGTVVTANRAVLELISGFDMNGLVARHKCDNRGCVNPSHLEPGTQAENVNDAVIRGRLCKGQARVDAALNSKSVALRKMTEEEAFSAFKMVEGGQSRREVGAQFGVTKGAIDKMMSGDSWSHITGIACIRHTWRLPKAA